MEQLEFNINYDVFVKLTDKGIEHYVRRHNSIMPFKLQISFKDFKSRANSNGYHRFQMWQFVDMFGEQGMRLSDLIDLNIIFDSKNFKKVI